jgi:excisionase family DNA binding protein
MSPNLLSVREVAVQLRVHRSTVYGLCDRGKLTHVRVSNAIRIRVEAVEELLSSRSTSARHRSLNRDGLKE